MKIPEKIQAAIDEGRKVFSFEYFPPKTADGVENLFDRMDRMVSYQPSFCDITWGAGGSTADLTLDIATRMQNEICVETSMHLTCTNMPVDRIDHALDHIKAAGLQNVLALRGDPPHGEDKFVSVEGGFNCALDLVKHIRAKYGDYFGITVAGYPEAHPDAISGADGATPEEYQKDLEYLKAKMDAGADLIVTQLFYDVDVFLKFVSDCRAMGIMQPVIPGIMPITTYGGFKRMTGFCKTKVPAAISSALESIKDNEEAVRAYGIQQGTDMCRRILESGVATLHMYTLNQDKTTIAILKNLGLVDISNVPRSLPWRPAVNVRRANEDVRPIYWSHRPRSYLARTSTWDNFPTSRFGGSGAVGYSALPAKHQQWLCRKARVAALSKDWGVSIAGTEDVKQLFTRFCSGALSSSPWSETVEATAPSLPSSSLSPLIQAGLLPINAQTAVNGRPSSDPTVGWGPPNGFVYQKSYLEFFAPLDRVTALLARAKSAPSVSLTAVNAAGHVLATGTGTPASTTTFSPNAVTWGVFPGREVVQPTVADFGSFLAWKEEAFSAWVSDWVAVYKEEGEGGEAAAAAKKVLQEIHDTYYLVSVVDNDYLAGDTSKLFADL